MKYEGIVYRPPSEAYSLILQITIGCAHNRCTFCTMYKDKKFRIRSMEEINADIEEASRSYGSEVDRVFLADGDALIIPTKDLLCILEKLRSSFPALERISSYGAPEDVLHKSLDELKELKAAGLDMVYMGLESGDDEVLRRIRKGVTSSEIAEACIKLKEAGITTSVTMISGLGGKERLREHAIKSAEAVSAMKPDYLGFLTLLLEPGAPLLEELHAHRFELLKPADVMEEMNLFLSHVDSEGTVFRANHASNYLMLKGTLNRDIPYMLGQVKEAGLRERFRDEVMRSL